MSSPSSSASDSGDEEEVFGRLLNITDTELVALGLRIRDLVFKVKTSEGRLIETRSGSYNLVRIIEMDGTKMAIRIPRNGRFGDLHTPAKEALESHVWTLRYIKEHTDIPVPKVLHFDTTANNEIGAPYIAMSHIKGQPVSSLWFENCGSTLLEERRQNILKQLAQAMSQLNLHHFDKIGSLIPNNEDNLNGYHLGPCFNCNEAEDGTITITSSGPFSTTTSFLRNHWAPTNEKSPFGIVAAKLLEDEILPLTSCDSSEFVLALPDFDSQNIMADENGNITGIIDWDNVQTVPGFMGCLRYPGWITRDWDPLMYGWPQCPGENSPDELQKYRWYYLQEIKQALISQEDVDDFKLTEKSHIFEAFWIAVSNRENRPGICQKFVEEARSRLDEEDIPEDLDENGLNVLYDIAGGYLDDEDWKALRKGLRALVNSE